MTPPSHAWGDILTRPRIGRVIVLLCLCVIFVSALQYALPQSEDGPHAMTDYEAFFVAGHLFWDGRMTDAYSATTLRAAQEAILGTGSFMPWTYPPQYNLLTALLALLPLWAGYVLFMLATLGGYIAVLRRLAGPHVVAVLVAVFPALIVCLRTGQNGLLTGALFGLFAHLSLRQSKLAGLPLGLLTFKPHLLVGTGLLLLLGRAWRIIFVAAAVTVAVGLVTVTVQGVAIWPAFLSAIEEAGVFLAEGAYPMFRMTSVYAALLGLGSPVWVAATAQTVVASGIVGLLVLISRRSLPARHLLGIGLLSTLFFSPYAYDYDLPFLGVALALLLPDLMKKSTGGEVAFLLALVWLASGSGITLGLLGPALGISRADLPSIGAFALVLFYLFTLRLMLRPATAGT